MKKDFAMLFYYDTRNKHINTHHLYITNMLTYTKSVHIHILYIIIES